MQAVIQVSPVQLANLQNHYATNRQLPPGAVFAHQANGLNITGYRSGKVLFQGQNAEKVAAKWGPVTPKRPKAKPQATKGDLLPTNFAQWSVLGSDEVGNGSYFGPLTIAAVYVSHANLDFVNQLGVADSKTLTDAQIDRMAQKMMAKLPYHIVNIMPPKYNTVHATMNIEKMKAISHNFALLKVLQKIQPTSPDGILIDQFEPRGVYYNYLKNEPVVLRDHVYFATKAEHCHLAVAAASIIARHQANLSMLELSKKAGRQIPLGNHQAVNQIAADLLAQGGMDYLGQFAKLHFINTQKAQQLL
ncbi:ribonuclease HIII [Latilactobacillus graminis]|uniref:Ribonuclease HIII n=2 Tax=Latilactobacillus graminis TaxID=60519 RepID=A0AA89L4T0_9LACO|nr:ribonuclease HIII [Latilactobacillus graminis]KRM24403.1 ribonuclease HIII [Latilactobacillus graminis DSM 20719]QFP80046.1 ribonuclease HIII [Latilactobacillus graminis]